MSEELQAQGLMDVFKLLSKENIEKVDTILKAIAVKNLGEGVVRISIDVKMD